MPRTGERIAIAGDKIYPISPEQMTTIEALKDAIAWNHPDGYSRWLLKYFALTQIEWSPEASVVINALRKLLKGQRHCSSCEAAASSRRKNG
jgi:hypothetical protein